MITQLNNNDMGISTMIVYEINENVESYEVSGKLFDKVIRNVFTLTFLDTIRSIIETLVEHEIDKE